MPEPDYKVDIWEPSEGIRHEVGLVRVEHGLHSNCFYLENGLPDALLHSIIRRFRAGGNAYTMRQDYLFTEDIFPLAFIRATGLTYMTPNRMDVLRLKLEFIGDLPDPFPDKMHVQSPPIGNVHLGRG